MNLKVNIEYKTVWGESVVLCAGKKKYPLQYVGDGYWQGEFKGIKVEALADYFYEIVSDGKCVRSEWRHHFVKFHAGDDVKELVINDLWIDRPYDAPFYSSVFVESVFGRTAAEKSCAKQQKKPNALLQVSLPTVRPNEVLAVATSIDDWKTLTPMCDCKFPYWRAKFNVKENFFYKFVIADKDTMAPIAWEMGPNRFWAQIPGKGQFLYEVVSAPQFNVQNWRGAGTAIPVFSLRTEEDFGVGEFLDLKKMVDWAESTGQNILQLLPINDTTMTGTWQDSYPYNANSTFALHPQFINLKAAGVTQTKALKALQAELNSLEQIDYERVNNAKIEYLHKAFDKNFEKLSQTEEYKSFIERNQQWLTPYAAFCALRDINGTPDFTKWGKMSKYTARKLAAFAAEHQSEMDFHRFVQFHLDKQLAEVCAYARSKGVVLKGDLPIGISRTSVDAWIYPELFHMDSQAGAPPDAFSEDGQNWGFPTYNWEKMAEDDFAWWKARLAKMSEYFDAFRIDHILGFFRIWQIPMWSKSGLDGYFNPALPYSSEELRNWGQNPENKELFLEDPHKPGYYHPRIGARKTASYGHLDYGCRRGFDSIYDDFFYHRHNEFWKDSAMKKLPALLDSTKMLACGEDLGMIPATVPDVMAQLRILSLEIQNMPKDVNETFANPLKYPYLSVCTTSTHDMNPLRAWWEEDRELSAKFYREALGCYDQAPYYCEPWICQRVIQQHLASPAMLTILPLQEWMAMDGELRFEDATKERINVPANPRHYWRYRMHLTIERLQSEEKFNALVSEMISDSGR